MLVECCNGSPLTSTCVQATERDGRPQAGGDLYKTTEQLSAVSVMIAD